MAAVYSTLFKTSHAGAGGDFTVATGEVWVLRCVTAFNGDAIAPGSAQLIHSPSDCTIYQRSLDPQVWATDEMRFVANAGDVITLVNGSEVDLTVSGYRLTLP